MNAPNCRSFLDGRVRLYAADCREALRDMQENSIDSCVTDPPYHLTSIVKRFGKPGSAPVRLNGIDQDASNDLKAAYARHSAGFMGKQWDGGDIAFTPELWREVFRILKPGAHLVAFGGTRTCHRMVCAIEDAGFEIRDQIQWLYGSGLPKSHDVAKGIDKANGRHERNLLPFGEYVRSLRQSKEWSLADLDEAMGTNTAASWWEGRKSGIQPPGLVQYERLKSVLGMDNRFDELINWLEAEREVIGKQTQGKLAVAPGQGNDRSAIELNITAPATPDAIKWEGWGTALKPAWEPICLARKPLSEATVAANVLRWGTGALNIDGCRVAVSDADMRDVGREINRARRTADDGYGMNRDGGERVTVVKPEGRWPANLCHDGSEEVLAGFPKSAGQNGVVDGQTSQRNVYNNGAAPRPRSEPRGDSGSAARFFYTAKADADDRLGSKHPTVKPVDLMQWLCRLITPPRGTILDPFAGTGTTGEAAFYEGFNAILIEREAEYCADIGRRMKLCLASPGERQRESIKARGLVDKNPGPLFAESWDEMWKRPFDWKKFREDAAE